MMFLQRLLTEVLTTVSIDHFFVKVELLLGAWLFGAERPFHRLTTTKCS